MDNKRDNKNRKLQPGERQRSDGRYEYRYTDVNGETHSIYSWKLVESDRQPAGKKYQVSLREQEAKIQKMLIEGLNPKLQKKTLMHYYEKTMELNPYMKQNTRNNYEYVFNKYLNPRFGDMVVSKITYLAIKEFYIHLNKDCHISLSTIKTYQQIFHKILATAVADNAIAKNPSDHVISDLTKSSGEQLNPPRHALTIPQQTLLVQGLKNYPEFEPIFICLLGTGCRISELLGLRWKDVNFDDNYIDINHALLYIKTSRGIREHTISTPKTRSGERRIPLLPRVKEELEKLAARNIHSEYSVGGYTDFIFLSSLNKPYSQAYMNKILSRIVSEINKSADEESRITNISCHVLRHTFCTRFCENETNIKVIQEIMGHSDIKVTMEIYNEATWQQRQKSIQNLASAIAI